MKKIKCSGCGSAIDPNDGELDIKCDYCGVVTRVGDEQAMEIRKLKDMVETLAAAEFSEPQLQPEDAEVLARREKWLRRKRIWTNVGIALGFLLLFGVGIGFLVWGFS